MNVKSFHFDENRRAIIEKEEDVLSDFDSEFKIESQEEFSLCDGAEYILYHIKETVVKT